jgi:hypothetical protein
MRDCKNEKYSKKIIDDAEIIQFIKNDVEYASTPLFS